MIFDSSIFKSLFPITGSLFCTLSLSLHLSFIWQLKLEVFLWCILKSDINCRTFSYWICTCMARFTTLMWILLLFLLLINAISFLPHMFCCPPAQNPPSRHGINAYSALNNLQSVFSWCHRQILNTPLAFTATTFFSEVRGPNSSDLRFMHHHWAHWVELIMCCGSGEIWPTVICDKKKKKWCNKYIGPNSDSCKTVIIELHMFYQGQNLAHY